jgi:hypothetical protein
VRRRVRRREDFPGFDAEGQESGGEVRCKCAICT